MRQPKVSVVTLTNGTRPKMLARAIACFNASTYANAEHVVFNAALYSGRSVGYIRNIANACADGEIIAHADDDDWSHPRRLEEQVALLEASGKMCVGYRQVLFWDTREATVSVGSADGPQFKYGEAWLYRNGDPRYAVGASFLYRRELWEQQPFDDAPHEDQRWWCTPLVSNNCVGASAMRTGVALAEPRLICQIHGSNTEAYDRKTRTEPEWRRAPEWDAHCAERMRL